MKQTTVMIKEDGFTWYSESYIKEQIEQAYQSGIAAGASIKFHAITPFTEEQASDLSKEFFKQVEKQYSIMYQAGKVIRKP